MQRYTCESSYKTVVDALVATEDNNLRNLGKDLNLGVEHGGRGCCDIRRHSQQDVFQHKEDMGPQPCRNPPSPQLSVVSARRHRIKPGQALGADEIYIGHGHHSHNHRASKWASPFKVGQHGTAEECLLKYMDYMATHKRQQEHPHLPLARA